MAWDGARSWRTPISMRTISNAWSNAQTDLLRAGRFAEFDLAHLIDEIEDRDGRRKVDPELAERSAG
jgi:Domain of unknown function DUF29